MKTIAYIRWVDPPLWKATLANLLPLWLIALAFLPFSFRAELTGKFFLLSLGAMIVLLWLRWFTPELILYSFSPIILSFIFEEVSLPYKTPLTLFCTLLLTLGIVGYRISIHRDILKLGWLLLLAAFIGTWYLASTANQNYWQMIGELGYGCDPFGPGCPAPVPAGALPWWLLFFRSS